jgi:uncharacterized protein with PIN domain
MESTREVPSLDEIADLLMETLTQSGQLADLGNASLEALEEEVLEKMDQVTCRAISKLLTRQARQAETPQACPRCGGALGAKPAQERSLQSLRGRVTFRCDVFRCEACRLDFFPSVQNSGL